MAQLMQDYRQLAICDFTIQETDSDVSCMDKTVYCDV